MSTPIRNWRTDPAFTSASGTFVINDGPPDNPAYYSGYSDYPQIICGNAPTLEDAYLIAAAPDLLDALSGLITLVEMDPEAHDVGSDLWAAIFRAHLAIDRAEGKES